jgi:hypothetical protein
MKKLFFLFALLTSIAASASVTVTPLSTDFTNKKVTFRVAWNSAAYNNRVWVWVDLCPIAGTQPSGAFTPAVVANPAITGGNGVIANPTTRGFFITYAGTNSGTTLTATLSNANGKFNWCAHGSDYPPNAVINADGGYTLKGTSPFTINDTKLGDGVRTFGAGTCITSITDLTGNPDGIVPALPSLSSPNSPSRCEAGAVTLSVTVSGGTTTAMTYTWNIGGTTYTNQSNSYTTGSLSASTTYSVKVKNTNNCESNTVNGTITVNNPGTVGSAPHASCGCVQGTVNCRGICAVSCVPTQNATCRDNLIDKLVQTENEGLTWCRNMAMEGGYSYWSSNHSPYNYYYVTWHCYRCN